MSKIGLIIGREFNVRVRKRSFILTTLLVPILMVAMMAVPVLVAIYGGGSETKTVVVSSPTSEVASQLKNTEDLTFVLSTTPYPDVVSEYEGVYGYLVLGEDIIENPASAHLYTTKSATMEVQNSIERQLSGIITSHRIAATEVEGLGELMKQVSAKVSLTTYDIEVGRNNEVEQKSSSTGLYYSVAYAGGFIIYMFILIYGMVVLQGVVEEKSNRIIEVMVSSVRPFELMLGKILGIASVAVLQFLIWVVLIVGLSAVLLPILGSTIAGGAEGAAMASMSGGADMILQNSALGGVFSTLFDPWFITRVLGSFLIFFIGGYLLYASMFAAVGSAVDNVADTQQLQVPITIPLILAIFLLMNVMNDPFSELAFWSSMIPFTSPVIMMARVSYGVPLWEFALSVTLLYGTFIGMTYLAAKIYRTGIFMYGKKPTLREFLSWMRYK